MVVSVISPCHHSKLLEASILYLTTYLLRML